MDVSLNNKDNNFSLQNIENYKTKLDSDIDINYINYKYIQLVTDYLKFIVENLKIRTPKFARFIITRGLDTITNVFLNILYYTKNIDITYFHCQKSFYFYVEFVGQITEEDKMFLLLTSRDATIYVYKKTIFEIKNELKKKSQNQSKSSTKNIFVNLDKYIYLYKTYIFKIINCEEFTDTKYISGFINISNNINSINLNDTNIQLLLNIVDNLYYIIDDIDNFFDINQELIKRITKNVELLKVCQKPVYEIKEHSIGSSTNEFIKWLTS